MSTNSSKATQAQEFTAAATGAQQQLLPTVSVTLGGQAWTQAQIIQVFTAATTALAAVAPAKAQLQQLVKSQATAFAAAHQLLVQLKKFVELQFGSGSPVMAAFGFKATAPKQKSAATKAIAAAKSMQTRQVRGTKGTRQKQAVTVSGSAGLLFVQPNGAQVPGVIPGPVPPGAVNAAAGNTPANTAGK